MKNVVGFVFGFGVCLMSAVVGVGQEFSGKDISGMDFSSSGHKGSEWYDIVAAKNTIFSTAASKTDYEGAYFSGNLTYASFNGARLAGANFYGAELTNVDFSNADLSNIYIAKGDLTGAKFANAEIGGARIKNFSASQLYETRNYVRDNLVGINLSYSDLSGVDFSGKTLRGMLFYSGEAGSSSNVTKLANANFTNASISGVSFCNTDLSAAVFKGAKISGIDLRGASYSASTFATAASMKNVIGQNGVLTGMSMTSAEDYLFISSKGGRVMATLSQSDVAVSGGAKIEFESGASLSVEKKLLINNGGVLQFNIGFEALDDNSGYICDNSNIICVGDSAESGVVLGNGGRIVVNIDYDGDFAQIVAGGVNFKIITASSVEQIATLQNMIKNENLFLTLNGEEFTGDWNFTVDGSGASVEITSVPEPAMYAAILGMAVLVFVMRRGRK